MMRKIVSVCLFAVLSVSLAFADLTVNNVSFPASGGSVLVVATTSKGTIEKEAMHSSSTPYTFKGHITDIKFGQLCDVRSPTNDKTPLLFSEADSDTNFYAYSTVTNPDNVPKSDWNLCF